MIRVIVSFCHHQITKLFPVTLCQQTVSVSTLKNNVYDKMHRKKINMVNDSLCFRGYSSVSNRHQVCFNFHHNCFTADKHVGCDDVVNLIMCK